MSWKPACSEEYKQRVLRARAMSPEEKFLAGQRLFEEECEQLRATIRKEMPGLCEEMLDLELRSRLEQQREEEGRDVHLPNPKDVSQ
jgi:hypothetical protein